MRPRDEIEPDALSTLSITLVPVPKPESDAAPPPVTSGPDIGVLGFAPVQVEAKRRRASDDGWRRDVALAAQWAATAAAIEAPRCR